MKTISIQEDFPDDHISRTAGEKLRKIIVDHAGSKLQIDFSGTVIASTSFFDEGFAKLSEEPAGARYYREQIEIVGIHFRDLEILEQVCRDRGWKW